MALPLDKILDERSIHMWCVHYRSILAHTDTFRSYLSVEEMQHSRSFKQPQHRDRYVCGRGVLRQLLGHYLQESSQDVQIRYAKYNKPFTPSNIHFNVSHAGDMLIIVLNLNHPIGVDIEWVNPRINTDLIAPDLFSHQELKTYRTMPESLRLDHF